MGGLECVITGLMDEFCLFFAHKKYAREIFTLCAIGVSFSIATINVTPVRNDYFNYSNIHNYLMFTILESRKYIFSYFLFLGRYLYVPFI